MPNILEDENLANSQTSTKTNLILLGIILALGTAIRVYGVFHDLPFSYYGDELHFVKRSAILGTGDLNPHWFHKPAFLMYLLAFSYGIYFVVGLAFGLFDSVQAFAAHFLTEMGPFLLISRLIVAAFGVGTVYLTFLVGRQVSRSMAGGLVASLVIAVLLPMVSSSQVVKADVPAAFFITLAVYFFLQTRDDRRLFPLLAASAFAGVAMGTKYYGILLLPPFVLCELARLYSHRDTLISVLTRNCLVVLVFVAAFFVVSPYNFLDPTFGEQMAAKIFSWIGEKDSPLFDPDSSTSYRPGLQTVFSAAADGLATFAAWNSFTLPLCILALIGLVDSLYHRATRWFGLFILCAFVVFLALAATFGAYHGQPRHLTAVFPLLATLVYPGATRVVQTFRVSPRRALVSAAALACLAIFPTLVQSIRHDIRILRDDSRTAAYAWILENIPRTAPILLDDYGPDLQPDLTAIGRMQRKLDSLPDGVEAFTVQQRRRLDLLRTYPPADGLDYKRLGHPWWSDRELTMEEIQGSPEHRDMGNPLVDRLPKSIDEYRSAGVRYIVTNSLARARYFDGDSPKAAEAFPSFTRFYEELEGLEPAKTIDPEAWAGIGPIIWIYDLGQGSKKGQG